MMGAAMLKRHQFVRSLWVLYRLVVSITWGSQVQPLLYAEKIYISGGRHKISSGNFHSSLTFVHFSCTKNSTLKMLPTLRHLCYILFGI